MCELTFFLYITVQIGIFILSSFEKKFHLLYCSSFFMNRENVIPLIVKSLKNPRSALCKTAIMTSADIFSAYSDHIIDSLDPLVTNPL